MRQCAARPRRSRERGEQRRGSPGARRCPGSPAQQQQQPPSARRPRSPDLAPRRRGPSPPPPPARRVAVALRAYSPPLPMPPPAGYYARRPRSPSAPEYLGPPPGYERGAPRLVWPAEERLPRTASGDRYYGEAPPLPYGARSRPRASLSFQYPGAQPLLAEELVCRQHTSWLTKVAHSACAADRRTVLLVSGKRSCGVCQACSMWLYEGAVQHVPGALMKCTRK